MTLRARALGYFVEPRTEAAPRDAASGPPRLGDPSATGPRPITASRPAFLAPVAPGRSRAATRFPLRAAVLGRPAEAIPLGAMLANALRSSAGASAAAIGVWAPGAEAGLPGGPASPAAARLAARLAARELPAAARGRLAWLALDAHPVAAAVGARRAAGALEVPLVVVLAGPRCEVVEAVLAEQDLVVFACSEPEGPLARLAVRGCPTAALASPAPARGPARWLARSGLVGARGLPADLRSLAEPAAVAQPEPAGAPW